MGRCFWVLFIGFAFFLQRLHIHPWIVCLLYFKQSEHQNLIVDAGALSHLVDLLKRHNSGCNARAVNGLIRRAADAITNLAHENSRIKTLVRFVSICLSLWKPLLMKALYKLLILFSELKVVFPHLLNCSSPLTQRYKEQLLVPCEPLHLKTTKTKVR